MTPFILGILGLAFGALTLNLLTTKKSQRKQKSFDFQPPVDDREAVHEQEEVRRRHVSVG